MENEIKYPREFMLKDVIDQENYYYDDLITCDIISVKSTILEFTKKLNRQDLMEKWEIANKKNKRKIWIEAITKFYSQMDNEQLKSEHQNFCGSRYDEVLHDLNEEEVMQSQIMG